MSEAQMLGGGCLLFFIAMVASIVAIALRQRPMERLANHPMTLPTPARRRIRQHLSQQRREEKREIILAALLAGIEPAAIAELLRGNVQYNRRIIAMVRRLNQHRLERLNEPREQATTHPAQANTRLANAT
jgi:hypothetical protein